MAERFFPPLVDAAGKDAILLQLGKILASPTFVHAGRMGRFLRFVVERHLEGKAGELKEYLLAVEVFDRPSSFDPRVDPIVRVEARRLRSKLKTYYEAEGRGDELLVELPTGTYAPSFRRRESTFPAPPPRGLGQAVAVLPFANLSPEPDNEYFSDGLTEELIHALTKVPGLQVVAWNSAAQLKGRNDLCAAGRELNASRVLAGSVRRSGERLRITAQLLDVAGGCYLWSETYDRGMEDLFAIQEEIARAIARSLQVHLAGAVSRPTGNLAGYNLYLKGRYYWNKRTPDTLRRSVQCFEEALAVDPQSALAWSGLADAHSLLAEYGAEDPLECIPKARAAAVRAIEIDPGSGEAYTSLGLIRSLYDWEWGEAGRCYCKALQLNPGYATAHHWYGVDYLANLGRLEEAIRECETARLLDPLSAIIIESLGMVYMMARQNERALAIHREALELDPAFYRVYSSMGRACTQMGDYDQAIALYRKARSLAGDVPNILGALGQTLGLCGREDEARATLAQLEELDRRAYVSATCFALVHLGLGETARALEWLETGCRRRDVPIVSIRSHPAYEPLRSERRFQKLVRSIYAGCA